MRSLVATLLVLGLVTTASADRRKAERLFRSGERAYRAQNFLAAAQYFELSYKELPAPELAFSAAQAYRRAYRVDPAHTEFVEASIKFYEIYLKQVKKGGRVGDAADSLGEMLRERSRLGGSGGSMAEIEKRTLLGVSVQLADQEQAITKMAEVEEGKDTLGGMGVKLAIDGKVRELDTLHEVEPGDHVIRVEAPGYEPLEKRTRVIGGAQISEEVTLQPQPAQVTVTTEQGATVVVDGRGVGEAPLEPLALKGGSHVITVLRAGRKPVAREIRVTRAQKLTVALALEPTARRKAVKWVAIGSGLALGVTGFFALGSLYYDGQAQDHLAALQAGDQPQGTLASYNDARSRRDALNTAMWFSGGTGVALGLTAAWLYYFDSPSSEGVKVVPLTTGSGAAGAAIAGRF